MVCNNYTLVVRYCLVDIGSTCSLLAPTYVRTNGPGAVYALIRDLVVLSKCV